MIFCFEPTLKEAANRYASYLTIDDNILIAINTSCLSENTSIDGYVTPLEEPNSYKVAIKTKNSTREPLLVLAHEMVHVKQLVDKRLVLRGTKATWNDTEFDFPECYSSEFYTRSPWEMEAYFFENKLYKRYMNELHKGRDRVYSK